MAEQIASNKAFGGFIAKYKVKSTSLGGLDTQFNVFIPPPSESKAPVLYYLAGLTCTEDTAPWKAGFLRDAAEEGIAIVFPDTSPRGAGAPGEDDNWDFGTGAGFYLNATDSKYSKHYNMYDFVTEELPKTLATLNLPIDLSRESIFGHSMGGHGAVSLYLRNHTKYRSASGFAAVLNPTHGAWGDKAFKGYLSGGLEEGKQYDSTELIAKLEGTKLHILIDYGTDDKFYKEKQLLPENFVDAAKKAGFSEADVTVRAQEGYDHSYYFISTFGPEHIKYHAKFLKA
ncbi:carbohydrate esterase family 1 protein [Clavulina sp. PMI_390]|nr:carbohydrate esterase family 1 protein [Clavulina sp. PMI_390]